LSNSEEDVKRESTSSKASDAKSPIERVKELLEQVQGDRKKAALTMLAEGYNATEIGSAFKEATGTGIGGREFGQWKREAEEEKRAGEKAGPLLITAEKAFMAKALERFKTLTNELQAQIIDLGVFVMDTVTPQVPASRPEEKIKNTKDWLAKAVRSFQPEEIEAIEEFGATAFLAACELKKQISALMDWAEPSNRLERLAEKALYSPNPINAEAFNMLMTELMRSIHAVPAFSGKPTIEELPMITKMYAQARGIPEEEAEARLKNLPAIAELE